MLTCPACHATDLTVERLKRPFSEAISSGDEGAHLLVVARALDDREAVALLGSLWKQGLFGTANP